MAVTPEPPSEVVRRQMEAQRRKDTSPEVALRKMLFADGLRYRVNYKVPGAPRRTIDIAFPSRRVAVFIDGCFWHGCPQHGLAPKHNGDWWASKLAKNHERDVETTGLLESQGWTVLRFWEHEDLTEEAARVKSVIANR